MIRRFRAWRSRRRLGWKLAGLASLEPPQILPPTGKDDVGEFILALSLAHNDLKDVILMMRWLKRNRLEDKVEPFSGQWHGMRTHLERLLASYLYELLVLLKKQKSVIDSAPFQDILANVVPEHRSLWDELVATAQGGGTSVSLLARVRNNGSFHYTSTKVLGRAYRRFFYKSPKNASNEAAYLSLGHNQNETRLFYADATAQEEFHDRLRGNEKLLRELVHNANQGIIGVLAAFVASRGGVTKL